MTRRGQRPGSTGLLLWRAYNAAGYNRLIYTNTASVRADVVEVLLGALGGDPLVHGVLLTRTTLTVTARLAQREIGSAIDATVARSVRAAVELQKAAPAWVRRVSTDGRSTTDIAAELARKLQWQPLPEDLADGV